MSPSVPTTALQREIASRFGLVPNFFASAPDAPEIIERLWEFAKSAYIDNPIPSLFKERLFVYLSRFCEVRYCIIRHCAFLLGYGHSSGDRGAAAQTVEQVIRLLSAPTPWERDTDSLLAALEATPAIEAWPAPESELEDKLFSAATLLFVEPRRSERAQRAVRHLVGGNRFEYLLGLLAFIRTAHYWTVVHPDLLLEDDASRLLELNEELTRRLLHDPEAARCDMGQRLFAELEDLRALNERRELEEAKRALEVQVAQKEVLLKEVNHRLKNSLQVVSSILLLQGTHLPNAEATEAMRSASARVLAIAAVHERLYAGNNIRVVALGELLNGLCSDIGRALGCTDGIGVDLDPVDVPTDTAIPLALIVNELLTNAIKYAGPPCRVALSARQQGDLVLTVTDSGQGPSQGKAQGMGSRIVQALARQIGATVDTWGSPEGYSVALTIPLPHVTHEDPDRRGRSDHSDAP